MSPFNVVPFKINHHNDESICDGWIIVTWLHCAAAITPVPGGIGPMTIAALLNNTIQAAYMHANVKQESSRNQAAAGSA